MSSTFVEDTNETRSDNTVIILVNNDGTISLEPNALQELLTNQPNATVSLVRVATADENSQDSSETSDSVEGNSQPHVNVTVEGYYPPAQVPVVIQQTPPDPIPIETNPAANDGVDSFLDLDQEEIRKLESVLQSEQAKQILGENVSALLGPEGPADIDKNIADLLAGNLLSQPTGNDLITNTPSNEEALAASVQTIFLDHCYTTLPGNFMQYASPSTVSSRSPTSSVETTPSVTAAVSAGKVAPAPIRRSQRQMDRAEREQAEKIRAENEEMLQREKEEILRQKVMKQAQAENDKEEDFTSESNHDDDEYMDSKQISCNTPRRSRGRPPKRVVPLMAPVTSVAPDTTTPPPPVTADVESDIPKVVPEEVQSDEKTQILETAPTVTPDRKIYPKRVNRKPPAHLAEALGPALFSTPDIIKRVGDGTPLTPPAVPVLMAETKTETTQVPSLPSESQDAVDDSCKLVSETNTDDQSKSDMENKIPLNNVLLTQQQVPVKEDTHVAPVKIEENGEEKTGMIKRLHRKKLRKEGDEDGTELVPADDDRDGDEGEESDVSWNSEDDPDRLWCICRKPHNNRFMICCDQCEEWFHGHCVGVTKAMGQEMEKKRQEWTCPQCQQPGVGKLTKRKSSLSADVSEGESSKNVVPKVSAIPMKKDVSGTASKGKGNATKPPTSGQSCIVCKKPTARVDSIYCGDKCILKHAEDSIAALNKEKPKPVATSKPVSSSITTDRVVVMERKTGKILTDSNAPTMGVLRDWLKSNPTFEVINPGGISTSKFYGQKKPQQLTATKQGARPGSVPTVGSRASLPPGTPKLNIGMVPKSTGPTTPKTPTSASVQKQVASVNSSKAPVSKPSPGTAASKPVARPAAKTPSGQTPRTPTPTAPRTPTSSLAPKGQGSGTTAKASPAGSVAKAGTFATKPIPVRVAVPGSSASASVKSASASKPPLQRSTTAPPLRIIAPKPATSTSAQNSPSSHSSTSAKPTTPVTPSKRVSLDSTSDDAPTVSSGKGTEPIRVTVRKALKEALAARTSASDGMPNVTEETIESVVNEIELELYMLFNKDAGAKYKNKYRSLAFNIKDVKNQGLFRKILEKEISPQQLVRMSPEELASKELAEWRERESKRQLEMIKKTELDMLSMGTTYVMKTHKGEQVIEKDDSLKLIEGRSDKPQLQDEQELLPKDILPDTAENPPSFLPSPMKDKTAEHGLHVFDLNCSICVGASKSPVSTHKSGSEGKKSKGQKDENRDRDRHRSRDHKKKDSSSSSSDKVKHRGKKDKGKSSSSSKDSERRSREHRNSSSDKDRSSRRSNNKHRSSKDRKSSSSSSHSKDKEALKKEEPAENTGIINKPNEDSDGCDREPSSTVTIKTPDLAETESESSKLMRSSTLVSAVWRGYVNMADVTKFKVTAHEISGSVDYLGEDMPAAGIDVVGRIAPDTVWDYVAKLKKSGNKEILIVQFQPASDDEKAPYQTYYAYLNSRKRFGVVGNASKMVKDFYIIPLASEDPVPPVLLPLDGQCLENNRPDLLIGLIIRFRRKRSLALKPKLSYEPVTKMQIASSEPNSKLEQPPRSYTPPLPTAVQSAVKRTLDDNTETPIASKKSRSDSPTEALEDGDEPYSPGESDDSHQEVPQSGTLAEQRFLEQLTRRIEVEKQEILTMQQDIGEPPEVTGGKSSSTAWPDANSGYAQDETAQPSVGSPPSTAAEHDDENEAYSPSRSFTPPHPAVSIPGLTLTDPSEQSPFTLPSSINLPANLHEILASIRQQEATKGNTRSVLLSDPIVSKFGSEPAEDEDLRIGKHPLEKTDEQTVGKKECEDMDGRSSDLEKAMVEGSNNELPKTVSAGAVSRDPRSQRAPAPQPAPERRSLSSLSDAELLLKAAEMESEQMMTSSSSNAPPPPPGNFFNVPPPHTSLAIPPVTNIPPPGVFQQFPRPPPPAFQQRMVTSTQQPPPPGVDSYPLQPPPPGMESDYTHQSFKSQKYSKSGSMDDHGKSSRGGSGRDYRSAKYQDSHGSRWKQGKWRDSSSSSSSSSSRNWRDWDKDRGGRSRDRDSYRKDRRDRRDHSKPDDRIRETN